MHILPLIRFTHINTLQTFETGTAKKDFFPVDSEIINGMESHNNDSCSKREKTIDHKPTKAEVNRVFPPLGGEWKFFKHKLEKHYLLEKHLRKLFIRKLEMEQRKGFKMN